MTLLQILLSIIVILISLVGGLVAFYDDTLPQGQVTILLSLSGSLFAAGFVSAIFSIIKFYEEKGSTKSVGDIQTKLSEISTCINHLQGALHRIQSECFLVQDFPQTHTIIKSHPTEEVSSAISEVPNDTHLEIDALGLNLNQFYDDQVRMLLDRQSVTVRILIQNPYDEVLEQMCSYEGRELKNVQMRIFSVTQNWLETHGEQNTNNGRHLLLAWSSQFHSITMVRVNGTIFMRPRIINEAEIGNVVYEVYRNSINPYAFKSYKDYFEEAWRRSVWPDVKVRNDDQA